MNFMPSHKRGPHANANPIQFGVLLPGLSAADGHAVGLRGIHERDQFIQGEPAFRQALLRSVDGAWRLLGNDSRSQPTHNGET